MAQKRKDKDLFVGVDVGGTKILALLARRSGFCLARQRGRTPLDGGPEAVVQAVADVLGELLEDGGVPAADVRAVGLAIAGVVDPDRGRVIDTPNMCLSGLDAVEAFGRHIDVPVVLGNDVNLGTMGEKWLGAARAARTVVGIFIGTGIGGGLIVDGRLIRGAREAAGEIGHTVVQVGGPKCGCGNRGCLEALASRTAIERDLRKLIKKGKTVLPRLMDGPADRIRSSVLQEALALGDKAVTKVMRRASQIIGYACLTVRHMIDPEAIVLGGGVIEACGDFMLPIIQQVVDSDHLGAARQGESILESALGDDAVALGAVALAQQSVGLDPFTAPEELIAEYPPVRLDEGGRIIAGDQTYAADLYIRADGRPRKGKKRDVRLDEQTGRHEFGAETIKRVIRDGPPVLLFGTGPGGEANLSEEALALLARRRIELKPLPNAVAVAAYNDTKGRKALLLHHCP